MMMFGVVTDRSPLLIAHPLCSARIPADLGEPATVANGKATDNQAETADKPACLWLGVHDFAPP